MEYPIKLESLEALRKLNATASKMQYSIYVQTETGVIDAKSMLGLWFALSKPAKLIVPKDIEPNDLEVLLAAVLV